jgi:hypothetical protein
LSDNKRRQQAGIKSGDLTNARFYAYCILDVLRVPVDSRDCYKSLFLLAGAAIANAPVCSGFRLLQGIIVTLSLLRAKLGGAWPASVE